MNLLKRLSKGIKIAGNIGDIIKIAPMVGSLIKDISKLHDGTDPGEIDKIKRDLQALIPKLVSVKLAAENIAQTAR